MKKYFNLILIITIVLFSFACKKDEKIKITFDYLCDEFPTTTMEFEKNTTIIFPDEITRPNFIFKGWYLDNEFSEKISDDYKISTTIILFAKWEEIKEINLKPNVSQNRTRQETYKDVTFKICNDEELKMDLYLPPNSTTNKTPALFVFFGGGWIMGSKDDVFFMLDSILNTALANGIAIIVPNYRLSNADIKYPYPVMDVMDSIRYVVKYNDILNIDINKMGSIGYSAGGYMATMAAFAQDFYIGDETLKDYKFKLKYLVDMYGPAYYEEEEINKLSQAGKFMLSSFLGSLNFKDPKYKEALPSYYVDYNQPDVFIVHGLADPLVPFSQSMKFHNLLLTKGISSQLLLVEGANHTLGLADGYTKTTPTLPEVYKTIAEYILNKNK